MLLKPTKELEEGVCLEQQGYLGPPTKSPLVPPGPLSLDLTLDGVLVDWHPQVTAFLPPLHNVAEHWGSPILGGGIPSDGHSLFGHVSHLGLGGKTRELCGRQREGRG